MLLQGGGILNGAFAKEGLIDEISLIISPCLEVSYHNTPCFNNNNALSKLESFTLADTKILPSSGVWLYYKKSN